MYPVIGIIICGIENNRQFVSQPYIEAIESAGAAPIIIPQITDSSLFSYYLSICQGFLFCGGDDICPLLFGEDLKTNQGHTNISTDSFHLNLMRKILSGSFPILAICRGMQILNVALGGSIWQDISLRPGSWQNHMQISSERSEPSHKISFKQDSMLCKICGNHLETNSFHHQCIKTVGKQLEIAGTTADGVIEALEASFHPFCIGVQWHPECMYQSSREMRSLFAAFISSTRHPNPEQL